MDIFVTGTDTGVGKTFVTAGIAAVMQSLGYSMGVYKPVQSGAVIKGNITIAPDLHLIKLVDPNIQVKSTYNLTNPVAPALAAFLEGVRMSNTNFLNDYQELKKNCDFVIVEGAGGLMVPVFQDFLIRDLVKMLNLPLLIVARPDLGTINHTLLTVKGAKDSGIDILGIIISNYPVDTEDISIKTAPNMIEELTGIKILGILPTIETTGDMPADPENLIDAVINNINLEKVFKIKIPKLSENI